MFRELFENYKKGDKIKYLGFPAVIRSIEEYNDKTYYSIKYKGENGTTAVNGILSTDDAITKG